MNAKVSAGVQYGLIGMKKLDLGAFIGQYGKAKIAKLPSTLKKGICIRVSRDGMQDMVEFKPSLRFRPTFDVRLTADNSQDGQRS